MATNQLEGVHDFYITETNDSAEDCILSIEAKHLILQSMKHSKTGLRSRNNRNSTIWNHNPRKKNRIKTKTIGRQWKPKINPEWKPSGNLVHLVSGWVTALCTEIEVSQLITGKTWGYLGMLAGWSYEPSRHKGQQKPWKECLTSWDLNRHGVLARIQCT